MKEHALYLKMKRWLNNLIWQLRGYPAFDAENEEDYSDGPDYCQDCGCMLDWDMKGSGDDIVRPGYVTASGDVFCQRCGREYDEEKERLKDEEYGYDGYPDPIEQAEQDADDEEDERTWEDEV